MKVKILKVDLIRNFGGSVVNMNDTQAARYIKMGYVVSLESNTTVETKHQNIPTKIIDQNKSVWNPPESNLFKVETVKKEEDQSFIYPGVEDTLFPQIGV